MMIHLVYRKTDRPGIFVLPLDGYTGRLYLNLRMVNKVSNGK